MPYTQSPLSNPFSSFSAYFPLFMVSKNIVHHPFPFFCRLLRSSTLHRIIFTGTCELLLPKKKAHPPSSLRGRNKPFFLTTPSSRHFFRPFLLPLSPPRKKKAQHKSPRLSIACFPNKTQTRPF